MNRRQSISGGGAMTVAGAAGLNLRGPENFHGQGSASVEPKRRLLIHVGTQRGPGTPQMSQFFKRHGVDHSCGYPPDPGERGYRTLQEVEQTREVWERYGITLSMVTLPLLYSSQIDRAESGEIILGKSPERERDIEHINKMAKVCAKLGVCPLGSTT